MQYTIRNCQHTCKLHNPPAMYRIALDEEGNIFYDSELPLMLQIEKVREIQVNFPKVIFRPFITKDGLVYLSLLRTKTGEYSQKDLTLYDFTFCLKKVPGDLCDKNCTHLYSDEIDDRMRSLGSLSSLGLDYARHMNASLVRSCKSFKISSKRKRGFD